MPYTGNNFLQNLRNIVSQYTTEFISVPFGNLLAMRALFNLIEDRYAKNSQKSLDEISGLLKVDKEFLVYNNRSLVLPYLPISSIAVQTVGPPGIYTINFSRNHNLGNGVGVTISGVTVATNANGNYTFATSLTANGQYVITSSTSINIRVATAAIAGGLNGQMVADNMVTDYYHLLNANVLFSQQIEPVVTNATNATPIVISITSTNNLRTTERIKISGVQGNTSANGEFYIKKQKKDTFAIFDEYTEPIFTNPAIGNGVYTSGGVLAKVYERDCQVLLSDQKITKYKPKPNSPFLQTGDKELIYYPLEYECSRVSLDYISLAAEIDCNNNTIDLLLTYNINFLNILIDMAARDFLRIVNSPEEFAMFQQTLGGDNAAK